MTTKFKVGDRVKKVKGHREGFTGTVLSTHEDGTLLVSYDGYDAAPAPDYMCVLLPSSPTAPTEAFFYCPVCEKDTPGNESSCITCWERLRSERTTGSAATESEVSQLQKLVDEANRGQAAREELNKHLDKLEWCRSDGNCWQPAYIVPSHHLRIKPPATPPAFQPFYVGPEYTPGCRREVDQWLVKMEGAAGAERLHVACKSFDARELLRVLKACDQGTSKAIIVNGQSGSYKSEDVFYAQREGVRHDEHLLPWLDVDKVIQSLEVFFSHQSEFAKGCKKEKV